MPEYLTKSLDPNITDEELEKQGCYTVSFISFESAIRRSLMVEGIKKEVKGYKVTHEGIEIIWE